MRKTPKWIRVIMCPLLILLIWRDATTLNLQLIITYLLIADFLGLAMLDLHSEWLTMLSSMRKKD